MYKYVKAARTRKPKWYDSLFGQRVRDAYDNREFNAYDFDSIRSWFERYNAPMPATSKDLDNIYDIAMYYESHKG